jgi:hypothetical protein
MMNVYARTLMAKTAALEKMRKQAGTTIAAQDDVLTAKKKVLDSDRLGLLATGIAVSVCVAAVADFVILASCWYVAQVLDSLGAGATGSAAAGLGKPWQARLVRASIMDTVSRLSPWILSMSLA